MDGDLVRGEMRRRAEGVVPEDPRRPNRILVLKRSGVET